MTTVNAGDFATWFVSFQNALANDTDSDVPCGDCTACCRSKQFIHVAPNESEAKAAIPSELLFPAVGLPNGYLLMGYNEQGSCPMLVVDKCTIYHARPQTCRTYDCRVFAVTKVDLGPTKRKITERVNQWEFSFTTDDDKQRHDAIFRAANYLQEHPECMPDEIRTNDATHLSLLAIEISDLFMSGEPTNESTQQLLRLRIPRLHD